MPKEGTLAEVKKDVKASLTSATAQLKKDFKKEMEKDIQKTVEFCENEIKQLKSEVATQKAKTDLVADLLHQSHQVSSDLAKRLDALELSNAKKSLLLSGLKLSSKKKERLKQIMAFFEDIFEYTPRIVDTCREEGSRLESVNVYSSSRRVIT